VSTCVCVCFCILRRIRTAEADTAEAKDEVCVSMCLYV